jgi:hypothetical protein
MRPKILITRKIFDEVISLVKEHFDVEDNQNDIHFSHKELIEKLKGKMGAIIRLTDQIDEEVVSQCKGLKVISNVAVGYNNIDVEACTRHGIMVTNTPGVLTIRPPTLHGPCSLPQQGGLLKQINIFDHLSGRGGSSWTFWVMMSIIRFLVSVV